MNSIFVQQSGLMVTHELQTFQFPSVGCIVQIEGDVDVVRMFLVRNEAAVDIDGFIEQGPDLVVYAIGEIFEQILSMRIPGEEVSYFYQCTIVYSSRQKAVLVEFRNRHLRIFFVSWLMIVQTGYPTV